MTDKGHCFDKGEMVRWHGWIKLHRKILDNPIFLKPDLYQLFSYGMELMPIV